jgi:tetratricopeptide (TPR) repeat protein
MKTRFYALIAAVGIASATVLVGPGYAQDPATQVAGLYRDSYSLETNRDYPASLAKMREIKTKAGSSYFVSLRVGWLSYAAGDFTAAEAGYREAIAAAPKAVEAKLGLTLPLLAAKKWRDLERACRDVIAVDPNNAVARARLAHALYSLGNYPDSATEYRKLSEEYPSELDHQTGLGWALVRMGRKGEAKQVFAAVVGVSPDNVNARQGLALP